MEKVVSQVKAEEKKNLEFDNGQDTKQVYINSFEAADIYNNQYRDIRLDFDYSGMIPYSLELIKLRQIGLNVKMLKTSLREFSDDIINVRFKHVTEDLTDHAKKVIARFGGINYSVFKKKLDKNIKNLKEQTKKIAGESDDEKKKKSAIRKKIKDLKKMIVKLSSDNLRKLFYLEGFTFNGIHYVHYKRSAAKSRQGQCLFIREELYKPMIKWSQMGINFPQNENVDLARLLSSECLVSTSIEETIKIDPRHILIIEDIERPIHTTANVITQGKDHLENNLTDNVKIDNCLTDGEALLDAKKFKVDKSMMLLRNHMFKAAAFSTNLQTFFNDNNVKKMENMFHEPIDAENVEMVVTPSCCKFLKFADFIGSKQKMWNYWIKLVEDEGNVFGICKHEKESKYHDEDGKVIQRTSYQMLNSLEANQNDITELCQYEISYIDKLQNDDASYIQYLEETKNSMNSNEMMIEIYENNPAIVGTTLFRDYRAHKISEYKRTVRKGKLKLAGDYCVLFGNPLTYLYKTINEKPKHELISNECYCKMFDDQLELAAFRNPHTAPSNIVVLKNNMGIREMKRYFNLSKNVVAVNADKFPLQRHLSGCDYDSDSAVLFSDKKIVEISKRSFKNYPVCINGVEGEKADYKLCLEDEYKIDSKLKDSQQLIGEVVNSCQQVMSKFWDQGGNKSKKGKELLEAVNIATCLSEICIDLAKKYYPIKFKKEIKYLKSLTWDYEGTVKKKKKEVLVYDKRIGTFWKYIKDDISKNQVKDMNCPMEYLEREIDKIKKADDHKDVEFSTLLKVSNTKSDANRKQIDVIVNKIAEQQDRVKHIMSDKNLNDKTKTIKRVAANEEARLYVGKLKIKDETFQTIFYRIAGGDTKIKNPTAVLNVMYQNHKNRFMEFFK